MRYKYISLVLLVCLPSLSVFLTNKKSSPIHVQNLKKYELCSSTWHQDVNLGQDK